MQILMELLAIKYFVLILKGKRLMICLTKLYDRYCSLFLKLLLHIKIMQILMELLAFKVFG